VISGPWGVCFTKQLQARHLSRARTCSSFTSESLRAALPAYRSLTLKTWSTLSSCACRSNLTCDLPVLSCCKSRSYSRTSQETYRFSLEKRKRTLSSSGQSKYLEILDRSLKDCPHPSTKRVDKKRL
jgi:hypothetical protein